MAHQIDWQNEPAPIAPGNAMDLTRCKMGSTPPLIVLNTRHVGNEMHWFGGRSYPHTGKGCPACAAKRPGVWKGYIGVWNPKTRQSQILEFTAPCTSAFNEHFLAFGTCRGAVVVITRKGDKANGRLTAKLSRSEYGLDQLPPEPNLKDALEKIWFSRPHNFVGDMHPGRPYVEPPSTTDEVIARRQLTDHVIHQRNADDEQISLRDAGEMLADKFAEANTSFRRNGRAK